MTARRTYIVRNVPFCAGLTVLAACALVHRGTPWPLVWSAVAWQVFVGGLLLIDWPRVEAERACERLRAYLRSRADCPDCGRDLVDCRCGGGAG